MERLGTRNVIHRRKSTSTLTGGQRTNTRLLTGSRRSPRLFTSTKLQDNSFKRPQHLGCDPQECSEDLHADRTKLLFSGFLDVVAPRGCTNETILFPPLLSVEKRDSRTKNNETRTYMFSGTYDTSTQECLENLGYTKRIGNKWVFYSATLVWVRLSSPRRRGRFYKLPADRLSSPDARNLVLLERHLPESPSSPRNPLVPPECPVPRDGALSISRRAPAPRPCCPRSSPLSSAC